MSCFYCWSHCYLFSLFFWDDDVFERGSSYEAGKQMTRTESLTKGWLIWLFLTHWWLLANIFRAERSKKHCVHAWTNKWTISVTPSQLLWSGKKCLLNVSQTPEQFIIYKPSFIWLLSLGLFMYTFQSAWNPELITVANSAWIWLLSSDSWILNMKMNKAFVRFHGTQNTKDSKFWETMCRCKIE